MAGRNKQFEVIALDIGPHMHSWLEPVKTALLSYVAAKMVNSPQHESALVTFGGNETKNSVSDEVGDPSQYRGIVEAWPLRPPSRDDMRNLSGVTAGSGSPDVADALVVAIQQHINRREQPDFKKYAGQNFSVLVVSTFTAETAAPDTAFLEGVVEQLKGLEVSVSALCLSGDGNTGAIDHILAETSNGSVRHATDTPSLFGCFRGKLVTPTTIYRGPLTFSPDFNIPVFVYKKTSEQKLPSLKKYSDKMAPDAPDATHDVRMETEHVSSAVPDKIVRPEEQVKAYLYGKQMVPMDDAQEQLMKFVEADKSFRVLGFVPKEEAPRWQFMADANVVIPEPGSDRSSRAMASLVEAMVRKGQVAIARAAWRKNTSTIIVGVLTPHQGRLRHPDSLVFNTLPTAEEKRAFTFSSFKEVSPDAAQAEAARTLVSRMKLELDQRELLDPESTGNPTISQFNAILATSLVGNLEALDKIRLEVTLRPPKHLVQDKAVKQAAAVLAERVTPASAAADEQGAAGTLPSTSGLDGDYGGGDSGQPMVQKVGTLTLVDDFNSMMAEETLQEAALQGMQDVITSLVQDSIGTRSYKMAMDCLDLLRGTCVTEGGNRAKKFNIFLSILKDRFACHSAHQAFWAQLAAAPVSLITETEVAGTGTSEQDAQDFLKPPSPPKVKSEPQEALKAEPADDGDDFDDMD